MSLFSQSEPSAVPDTAPRPPAGNNMAWAVLVLYLLALFGTMPFAADLWYRINHATGQTLSKILPILGIIGIGVLYGMLISRNGHKAGRALVSLTGIVACYGALFYRVASVPVEQYHLIEYSLLSGLVYWAFSRFGPFRSIVGWALLAVVAVGITDEVYQWFLPQRYFDLRDILLNVLSGLLGFCLIGLFAGVNRTHCNREQH